MKIGILGTGTWGIALGRMLSNKGHSVTMWSISEREVQIYSETRHHPNLPGMIIPSSIRFSINIPDAIVDMDIVVFAVPSPFVRGTAEKAAQYLTNKQIVVDVAKGIESDTLYTMTQVINDVLSDNHIEPKLVALTGPTHAE